ncbi:hypothetical protein CDAR_408901, partial [Caerostris darwini]
VLTGQNLLTDQDSVDSVLSVSKTCGFMNPSIAA